MRVASEDLRIGWRQLTPINTARVFTIVFLLLLLLRISAIPGPAKADSALVFLWIRHHVLHVFLYHKRRGDPGLFDPALQQLQAVPGGVVGRQGLGQQQPQLLDQLRLLCQRLQLVPRQPLRPQQ
ncbi:MAG: hypothetical protein VKM98_01600, partial [Cyanobacteriota bacterium]|nr:hypothetical protein [Cyanobacteriota bacterium]